MQNQKHICPVCKEKAITKNDTECPRCHFQIKWTNSQNKRGEKDKKLFRQLEAAGQARLFQD